MRVIDLGGGLTALIDDAFAHLSRYKWRARKGVRNNSFYAQRSVAPNKRPPATILMHREIMGFPNSDIDHVNGNGLDNRKCNLRTCDDSQNRANIKCYRNNTSGYKGVSWHASCKKWRAKIYKSRKGYYLGLFTSKRKAAKAYREKAQELYGEFASA